MAIEDEKEDRKRGLIAHDFLDPKTAHPDHPSSVYSNYYQPIRTLSFMQVLRTIAKPEELKFIDIGSGTGKAMILAAEYGFQDVMGVEFVPELCTLARQNIHLFSSRFPNVVFDIIEDDFRNAVFGDKSAVFLLNDPFDDVMMNVFVEMFICHHQMYPSWIIYKNVNIRSMPSMLQLSEILNYQIVDHHGNRFEVWAPR